MANSRNASPGSNGGRIGPNAILQLLEPAQGAVGEGVLEQLMQELGIAWPSGKEMIPESEVSTLHQSLFHNFPEQANLILTQAGAGTARYIRANRIPAPARWLLARLPGPLAEKLLIKAIEKHAWTFCGSGDLRVQPGSPCTFEIINNPFLSGMESDKPECVWHSAVFQELFNSILGKPYRVQELQCVTMGAPSCQFEVIRG